MCVSTLLLCPLEVYWIRKLWTLIVVSFIGLEIQGAKEEVKKDRKHKRNEKDRKDRDNEAGRSRKHRHKRRRKDEGAIASGKLVSSEVELLEKSCQTVELELQTSSQNSCDSTLHSNERPKQIQSQPLDGRHNITTLVSLFAFTCCWVCLLMVSFFLGLKKPAYGLGYLTKGRKILRMG